MFDDDDDDDDGKGGKGTDDDDVDDVNRTPTAFARRNNQQPESYMSSLQKHQAYHGHAGKAMIGPGFNKSIVDSTMQSIKHENMVPVIWLKTL